MAGRVRYELSVGLFFRNSYPMLKCWRNLGVPMK